ncbi:helix-turn-helix transcriptional regulator [Neisseriaceae bacterium ESL0693]|nr:helix-turn-helix transcriptional regulator [Neisseriaceae bacterium ESL0693]
MIGNRIKRARKLRQRSQEWLSEEVGVRQSSVSGWETGKTDPTTENMSRIAQVLDVNFEWLAKGTGLMTGIPDVNKATPMQEPAGAYQYYTKEELELMSLLDALPKSKRQAMIEFIKGWLRF